MLLLTHRHAEAQARARLQAEFPLVPERVITAILVAYRECEPTLIDAVRAARRRIADACAA